MENRYFAVKNKDDDCRLHSSSGSVFPVLAKHIVQLGGVVYGAELDMEMRVCHVRIEDDVQIIQLQGSKYVQSSLADLIVRIRDDLLSGRFVLFSGTPCQVAAIGTAFEKFRDQLLLCDLVCHGVTSPMVFSDYIHALSKRHHGRSITDFSFRDKTKGWKNQKWKVTFEDGATEHDARLFRSYRNLYYSHLMHRPSCYICPYTTVKRKSDFTLGDFWGVDSAVPGFSDPLGVSLVVLHTEKANDVWYKVNQQFHFHECVEHMCLQPQLMYPVTKNDNRTRFWNAYRKHGYVYVAKKYGSDPFAVRIKSYLKKILLR